MGSVGEGRVTPPGLHREFPVSSSQIPDSWVKAG
jgi:hypothetical protein